MFCTHCGRPNPNKARFCQKCGQPMLAPQTGASVPPASPPTSTDPAERARMDLERLAQVLSIHVPTDRCHRCSALNDLERFPFALGKQVSSESNYGEVGGSIAASAVTMALFGFGAVRGPQRKTIYRTIRLETALCRICRTRFKDWAGWMKRGAYEFHPWYDSAVQLGYDTIIVEGRVVS